MAHTENLVWVGCVDPLMVAAALVEVICRAIDRSTVAVALECTQDRDLKCGYLVS